MGQHYSRLTADNRNGLEPSSIKTDDKVTTWNDVEMAEQFGQLTKTITQDKL